MNKFKYFLFVVSLSITTTFSVSAQAYLTIAESAEIIPLNEFQAGFEPQFLLNRGGGVNFDAFLDMAFDDSTSGRISIGGGTMDFSTFASVKYIPFPDIDNQPAMGIRFGVGFARDYSENILLAQLAPLVSKKTHTDNGIFTPYIALPFQLINNKKETFSSAQFVVGSEYSNEDLESVRFGSEVGFELNKSYSYLSVYVTIPFDRTKGLTRR